VVLEAVGVVLDLFLVDLEQADKVTLAGME
jgi:hypothetical protein